MWYLFAGAGSSAVVKQLEVQGYALTELAMRHADQGHQSLQSNQETVAADISGQVGGVTGIPGQAVQAPSHSQLRGGVTGPSLLEHQRIKVYDESQNAILETRMVDERSVL